MTRLITLVKQGFKTLTPHRQGETACAGAFSGASARWWWAAASAAADQAQHAAASFIIIITCRYYH